MLAARASSGRKIPCRERHRIYVHDHLGRRRHLPLLKNEEALVIISSLASGFKRTGKSIKMDFAIVLTVANGQIVCFQDD